MSSQQQISGNLAANPAVLIGNPALLTQVLQMLTANDTTVIKQGEKIMKAFMKNKDSMGALMLQVQTSPDAAIRHSATLLLKKKISKYYSKLDRANKDALKATTLQILARETEKSVRTSIAGVIGAIAKSVFTEGAWPELFQLLLTFSQDPNEQMRATCFVLLDNLGDHISAYLKPHMATLAQLFTQGCQDPSSIVSVAAMRATSTLIQQLNGSPELMQLQCVITPLLVAIKAAVDRGDDEAAIDGLSTIADCAEAEMGLVNDHIEMVAPFIVQLLQATNIPNNIQVAAATALNGIVSSKPKLLAKKNLIRPILGALMSLLASSTVSGAGSLFSFNETPVVGDDDDDEEDEDEGQDIQRTIQTIIDTMAIKIPSKHFVNDALELCGAGILHENMHMRKAASAVLGVITEGCCDAIRQRLNDILPALLQACQDPEHCVRECATFALGQFSEHCQPDILHFHQMVLPVIFKLLEDSHHTVQGTACYVHEMYCENLQPATLRPFLVPLMQRLGSLLQSPQRVTQEMALTALSATAVAAEQDFIPFAEATYGILAPVLFSADPSLFGLRGRALECLGHIAVAIGGDHFERYFDKGIESAWQGVQLEDDVLREHAYVFFANSSKVMGKRFDKYTTLVMPHLLEVIAEKEVTFNPNDDDDDGAANPVAPGAEGDDEDDSEDGDYVFNGDDEFVNSKKAAITAVGCIAEYTKELFYPWLHQTCEALLKEEDGAIDSMHDAIRAEAVLVMKDMIISAAAANGCPEPVKGQVITLPEHVNQYTNLCLTKCISTLEDYEKLPVSQACEAIEGILSTLGMSALNTIGQDGVNKLMHNILSLLQEKGECQKGGDAGEGDGEDDDDHDNIVMDAVTDVIGALARAMGSLFIQYFDHFVPSLLKFTKDSRVYSDRSMAIGCFAEVFQEVGSPCSKYVETIIPIIQRGLTDSMESVRRNSAYCIGTLVANCGTTLTPHYITILQWLHPLCIRQNTQVGSDIGGADIDNAISTVARMIQVSIDSVPLAHILPVMLSSLPLRSDHEEGVNVYNTLIGLLTSNNPVAVSMKDQFLECFRQVVSPDSLAKDATKVGVRNYLSSIGIAC